MRQKITELTSLIRANVLDKIEIKTERILNEKFNLKHNDNVLVRRRVFERAAKEVIRIGPNSLWKLSAC